jgi:uncharacterized UPF0160 family protein
MINSIVTHEGTFHADEVFAVAVLSTIYPEATITRTRTLEEKEDTIFVDVGMKYDGKMYFDHHQKDPNLTRPDGSQYASAGLIWGCYHDHFIRASIKELLTEDEITFISLKLDDKLFKAVDAVDNGLLHSLKADFPIYSISHFISSFNAKDTNSSEQDSQFMVAVNIAKMAINQELQQAYNEAKAFDIVRNLITGPILELPEYMPYHDAIRDTYVEYVVFPDKGQWVVRSAENKFNFNSDLVEQDLKLKPYLVFCHKAGFIAKTKTKESALYLINAYGK